MSLVAIEATVDAVITDSFKFGSLELPVTFGAGGLSSGEEIGIEASFDNGVTWENWKTGNSELKITFGTKQRTLNAPGVFRFNKPITTNPVHVGISTGANP